MYSCLSFAQNQTSHERIRDAIWERNWFVAGAATIPHMVVRASDITLRNNVFDFSAAPAGVGILVESFTTGPNPISDRVSILNNTILRSSTGELFALFLQNATGLRIHNNLGRSPGGGTSIMITDNGGVTYATPPSNNSTNAQITASDPIFVAFPPVNATDWRVNLPSYALSRLPGTCRNH